MKDFMHENLNNLGAPNTMKHKIIVILLFTSYGEHVRFLESPDQSLFLCRWILSLHPLCSGNSLHFSLISTFHIVFLNLFTRLSFLLESEFLWGKGFGSFLCVSTGSVAVSPQCRISIICQLNALSCINTHSSTQPPAGACLGEQTCGCSFAFVVCVVSHPALRASIQT